MKYISEEQVKNVAETARLMLTDEEVKNFTKQLDHMLLLADKLNEIDTTDVKPLTHVIEARNVMREDKVESSLNVEEVLKNAPDHEDGQIKVPSILE